MLLLVTKTPIFLLKTTPIGENYLPLLQFHSKAIPFMADTK
jgi:hypothetical protein